MTTKFRCDCPITSALDVPGDKWTLVVVKQMLLEGKQTFKDFVESDEATATNILASRLKLLEESDLVSKSSPPTNPKNPAISPQRKGVVSGPYYCGIGPVE